MTARFGWVFAVILSGLVAGGASAQPAAQECKTLSCQKCQKVCTATCEADYKVCEAKHRRGCPRAYRSCERGCKFELCAQCMPVQYDGQNRKFLPGKTELCRTPAKSE